MNRKAKFKQTEIGMISEDWEIKELKELGKIGTGKGTKNLETGEYEIIGANGVIGFTNDFLEDCNLIYTGRVGTIGILNFLRKRKVWLSDNTLYFKSNDEHILKYVYYCLKRIDFSFLNVGSTQPLIKQSDFQRIKIIIPKNHLEIINIAKILSSLDDKIELLQQMNKTLEEIGQAIFKHWFVDLEFPNEEGKPYKSSGGEMVYNEELGKEIPKGWKVKEIGEFIEFVKGRKPDVVFDSYEEGLLPQILIDVLDGGNPNFSNPKDMIISDEADIIIVMDGASSGRTERGFAGILGSTLAKIKVKELNQDYAYYLLKGKEEDIKVNTTGTSIPHADKKKIEKYLIPVPSKKILEDFQNKVNKLLFRQILIRKEIKILSQIRDSLLPKVMAGKIRVPLEDEK